jgi:hypothetical protein
MTEEDLAEADHAVMLDRVAAYRLLVVAATTVDKLEAGDDVYFLITPACEHFTADSAELQMLFEAHKEVGAPFVSGKFAMSLDEESIAQLRKLRAKGEEQYQRYMRKGAH